jgi:hypothetical protein
MPQRSEAPERSNGSARRVIVAAWQCDGFGLLWAVTRQAVIVLKRAYGTNVKLSKQTRKRR